MLNVNEIKLPEPKLPKGMTVLQSSIGAIPCVILEDYYTADQLRAAVLEEREKWQADAERYRWLRIQPFDEVRDMFAFYGTEQQRDAAIDAARSQS